tara:strand:+ start:752 stop:1066 length:315 start_codon:yes stop_codon:yes gene_type:complete
MGEGFSMPYAWLPDMVEGLTEAKATGIEVLALTPNSDSIDVASLRYRPDDRVALLLGSEGSGLTERALNAATRRVRIPMSRSADSMNVANAAAVAFYALRQARS